LKAYLTALKLFILGLPGGGKSTIAHCVKVYLKDRNWGSIHFSDHIILGEMFQADTEHKQFKPTDHGGFDVLDLTVRDAALKELERRVKGRLSAKQEKMVLIEFARNDYRRAFEQFSATFLDDAYFLYLDVETDVCKSRILKRIANPSSEDDFYVSEFIFSTYYTKNNGRSIPQILASDRDIEEQRVKIIDNNGSLSGSIEEVYQFVDTMCGLEAWQDS
jgi:adenylate kinase family enzyme